MFPNEEDCVFANILLINKYNAQPIFHNAPTISTTHQNHFHNAPTISTTHQNHFPRYMQSLDYQHGRKNHYNRKQIPDMGSDGSYKLVLSHRDPGPKYNWLDTEGRCVRTSRTPHIAPIFGLYQRVLCDLRRETGMVFYRFFLNKAELVQATTTLVKFTDL